MADGLATPPSILIPDPDHRELHSDLDIYIFLLQNEHVCQTLIDEANQIRPPSGPPVQLIHPNLFLPLWIRLHSTNGLFAQELQTRITLIADHLIQIYRFDSALIPSIIYNWTYHAFEDDNPVYRPIFRVYQIAGRSLPAFLSLDHLSEACTSPFEYLEAFLA